MKVREDWYEIVKAELKGGTTILSTAAPSIKLDRDSERQNRELPTVDSLIASDHAGSAATALKLMLESIPPTNTTPIGIQRRDRALQDLDILYSSYVINTAEISFRPTPASDLPVLEYFDNNHKALIFLAHLRTLLPAISPSGLFNTWWKPLIKPILANCRWRPLSLLVLDISFRAIDHAQPEQLSEIGELLMQEWTTDRDEVWDNVGRNAVELMPDRSASLAQHMPFWETFKGSHIELLFFRFALSHPKPFYEIMNTFLQDAAKRCYGIVILSKVIAQYTSTEAKQMIYETPLLNTLFTICLLDSNMAIVTNALLILACLTPYLCKDLTHELQTLMQIFVRTIHWDVLYNSILKLSCSESNQLAAAESQVQHDVQMDSIDVIAWGTASAVQSVLTDSSIEDTKTEKSPDVMLITLAANSVRRAVQALFSVLYGIYPHSTLRIIRSVLQGNESDLPKYTATQNFQKASDPFLTAKQKVQEMDILDERLLVRKRLVHLIESHKMHPDIFLVPEENELRNVKRSAKDPAILLSECFEKRSPKASAEVDSPLSDQAEHSIHSQVFNLNRLLRNHSLDITTVSSTNQIPHQLYPSIDKLEIFKQHLFMLLGELNFEITLRISQLQRTRTLKYEKEIDDMREADREIMYQKLKQQQYELSTLHSTVEQLRGEASLMRDRHRTYEEDLTKRIKAARESAKATETEMASLKEKLELKDKEIVALRAEINENNARISELDQKILLAEPGLRKLSECELALKELSESFIKRESEEGTLESLKKRNEQLVSNVISLMMKLEESEKEVNRLRKVAEASKDSDSTSSSDIVKKLKFAEKTIAEHIEIIAHLKESNIHRTNAIEAKYQTLKQINLTLEARLMDLEFLNLRILCSSFVLNAPFDSDDAIKILTKERKELF
ncbi:hypothetical protein HDV05_005027 [Chytridiales sp. JEL 0842]|nr:hypothetical protein HDV05_005027 [Chytridiales sp. JEL 0842]